MQMDRPLGFPSFASCVAISITNGEKPQVGGIRINSTASDPLALSICPSWVFYGKSRILCWDCGWGAAPRRFKRAI